MIALVTELDQPTAQVLIEAHIIEATSETARELGVQWGGLYKWNRQSDNYWIAPNAGNAIGVTPATEGVTPSTGWASNFPANLSAASITGTGFSLGMIAETANAILAAQLTALEEEGKLNILSKPSITTLDNQTAIIESGDEVPFQTVDDNKVQIEYKKAVLRLEVTPHVIEGDTLKMDIITNKDELDFTRTVSGNPTVITKKAETNVVLFDGQTTVIGGLNKQTDRDLDYGLPWLRNIPGLGYLFKGESKNRQMQELLIFITPHILERRKPITIVPKSGTEAAPVQ
jgi:type IV pilus assembly protein PilQ